MLPAFRIVACSSSNMVRQEQKQLGRLQLLRAQLSRPCAVSSYLQLSPPCNYRRLFIPAARQLGWGRWAEGRVLEAGVTRLTRGSLRLRWAGACGIQASASATTESEV